jgi:pyruvate kinase
VCALCPATGDAATVLALAEAGMDVARLTFSHGSRDDAGSCEPVRRASKEIGRAIAVLADLQGPKIRHGTFASGPVLWLSGGEVEVTVDDVPRSAELVSTDFAGLPTAMRPGDRLLANGGNLAFEVLETTTSEVRCRVLDAGAVSDDKVLSLPGLEVDLPALTEKDEGDLRFGLGLGVDIVALSLVQQADDVTTIRRILAEVASKASVIANLENPRAVSNPGEIAVAVNCIMVARGDLGVEIPLEQVPLVQKRAIRLARQAGKAAIVATQMLESMVVSPDRRGPKCPTSPLPSSTARTR